MVKSMIKQDNVLPDFSTIGNIKDFELIYHEAEDTLFVRPSNPCPATSFDINGEIWVRIIPDSGEIVGLEIEDFQSVFLKKYPNLATAWAESKPRCLRKKAKTRIENRESFMLIIMNFLRQFFSENPQQTIFNVVPA